MLAGHLRSGGSEWQHGGLLLGKPTPLQPPSEACVARKGAAMPSSNLLVDYSAELGAFKVEQERGRVRVVSTFQQGFGGVGAERYPTGESYIGTYADAKRAGKGTFIDSDGATMLSVFKAGRAVGEGAKRTAGGDLMRTHDGKVDGVISLSDATSIAKNSGLAAPPITWAKSPPAATKKRTPLPKPPPPPPTNYTTETKAAYKSSTDASTPSRGDFMERLEQAERADVNSKNARMALIPRVA